ncbi:hypothetical protein L1887_32670 [Cichorium endivia]|nr:hypothetical protein L1887_32670 [Cichorium endivia]
MLLSYPNVYPKTQLLIITATSKPPRQWPSYQYKQWLESFFFMLSIHLDLSYIQTAPTLSFHYKRWLESSLPCTL